MAKSFFIMWYFAAKQHNFWIYEAASIDIRRGKILQGSKAAFACIFPLPHPAQANRSGN
jgi:hypothetical protein